MNPKPFNWFSPDFSWSWVNLKSFGDGWKDNTSDSMNAAVATVNQSVPAYGTIYVPPGTYTFKTNCTVPSNVRLVFDNQAIFSVNSGITLTINGKVEAPLSQHFAGSGTAALPSSINNYYPEWYGVTMDGTTDDAAAWASCIAAWITTGGNLIAGNGNTKIGSALTITGTNAPRALNFSGNGNSSAWTGFSTDQSGTKFLWYGGAVPMLNIVNGNGINLSGFTLDCRSTATYGIALNASNLGGLIASDWHNISIYTPQTYGIGLRAATNPVAHNRFSGIHIDGGKGGIVCDSYDKAQYNVDVHHNTFQEIMVRTDGTNPGIDLKSADNNWFYGVNVDQSSGSAGVPVYFRDVTATQLGAINNFIFGLDANSSQQITADAPFANTFVGVDYTNGMNTATGGTRPEYVQIFGTSNGQTTIAGASPTISARSHDVSSYARLVLIGKNGAGVAKDWRVIAADSAFDSSDGLQIYSATLADAVMKFDHLGAFYIKDGITPPATLSGSASIYIDVADGDLKIKFGDGTVKTITVDT